jgi:hypothetical protein
MEIPNPKSQNLNPNVSAAVRFRLVRLELGFGIWDLGFGI